MTTFLCRHVSCESPDAIGGVRGPGRGHLSVAARRTRPEGYRLHSIPGKNHTPNMELTCGYTGHYKINITVF